ncbi:MAG: DUF3667 domain-containing protein [Verrucomicrobiota bacterium]|nr:DUF3667 domain-containing protein [Verrucomicrobiota bacterium]
MADETSEAILGDTVAASLEKPERRRSGLFRRKKPAEENPDFTHCEDCGTELHGHYCSHCGQVAVDYRRSFRHVVADVAESFLNWDSKFTKTIGLLLLKPGWLTNQFVAGRRTRYLHPLRLYLLVSIAFFLGARLIPVSGPTIDKSKMTPEARAEIEKTMAQMQDLPESVRKQVNDAIAETAETPATGTKSEPLPGSSPTAAPAKRGPQKLIVFDDPKATRTPFERWMEQQVRAKLGEDGTKLQFFADTLRSNISTMMLFCIPLFALVLKILYLRKGRFYIEHLVYALHIHSFFYFAILIMVFSAMAASRWAPGLRAPLILILLLAILVQIFLSIRQVYRQGWFMTTFKFFFGGLIYFTVLAAALAITAIATFVLP